MTNNTDWRIEFDEKFPQREIPDAIEEYWSKIPDPSEIKSFIENQLEKARQSGRDEAVDYIDKQLPWGKDFGMIELTKILESARTNNLEGNKEV